MSQPSTNYEESIHYNGEVTVRFYPGAHYYAVTDTKLGFKNKRMGGATSLTGMMNKGQGLMLYPMYEMKKFLKNYFRSTTVEEFFNSPISLDNLLKQGTDAHVKKSDRGKSVGTDAHAWVEAYLNEALRVQTKLGLKNATDVAANREAYLKEFVSPEIPTVEELALRLRQSYIELFKATKPKTIDEYRALTKALFNDADVQEAMHTEATMLNLSTTAAKKWFEIHNIFAYGTEDAVYSRKMMICGKYDADLEVQCSDKCNWCYLNGDEEKVINILNTNGNEYTFTGRYITDFKSTNESNDAPKGIYKDYLAQCGTYDVAKTEEHPEINYDGHLILNGSKNQGTFNTHYSFDRARNRRWALLLAELKEIDYEAGKEIKASV